MNKNEFMEWLKNQPDDIQIFIAEENCFNCVDVKIFTEPKTEEFLSYYFGI